MSDDLKATPTEAVPAKVEIQNLTAYLDRLRGVLNEEDLAKAEFAWRKAYAPNGVETVAAPATPDAPAAQPTLEVQPTAASVAGTGSEAPNSMMRLLELGVTGLVSVVLALALFTVFSKPAKPAISFAMLDANIAIAKYLETPGVSDLDEQAFGAAVTAFHKALEAEMQRFTAETGRVLLAGSVVFAGDVPDVTDRLVDAARAKTPPLPQSAPVANGGTP